uniref:Cuticular protein 53 n=1 Tax=Leptinotarsa decemlineata TaxID=7539 RepID=A0A3Q8HPY3_LEPDE|nr:cuticular protein 53 [Leptinotarsa decemlineata]
MLQHITFVASVLIGLAVAGHHGGGAGGHHRDGKHVTGGYTLKEADGTHRIVKYKSGPHKGFEAVVERRGHAQHPAHYGKHGKHGQEHGGKGGTSYIGVTHWSNQGSDGHGHADGGHGHGNGGHGDGGHGHGGDGHSGHGHGHSGDSGHGHGGH